MSNKSKTFFLLVSFFIICMSVITRSDLIKLAINTSDSVPYRFFMVIKGTPLSKGNYASFYAPGNGRYPTNTVFTKKVAGVAGDNIIIKDKELWINHQRVGHLLAKDSRGHLLSIVPAGKIPVGFYFMAGAHEKSFDSRYQGMGLIPANNIMGRAYPLF